MKVTNHKVGGHLDTSKTGKSDSAQGLKKDVRSGAVSAKEAKAGSKVDVSERAQMMQRAKEIASAPDQIDEAKVARLQKMIDEGTYKVDADKLADKLVDEHMLIPD